jgi:AraC family transcriptional regulator
MKPRIEISNEKKLVGKRLTMNFADYKVTELWKSFMPRRNEIKNNAIYLSVILNIRYFKTC